MARLPTPGGDENTWGDVLNEFLSQAHNNDGSLKNDAIGGLQGTPVAGATPTDGQVLTYNSGASRWEPATPASPTVDDATTTDKGIVQLAGDLAGTADAPTVPALADKLDASTFTTHTDTYFTPHITVPAAWGSRWKQARTEAGSRQVRVHFWGGSITDGNPGASNPLTTAWAAIVTNTLRSTYGDGGTGYWATTRASKTGTWVSDVGFAASGIRATNTATLQYTGLEGTQVKIFYKNSNITGSFRWRVDGGSWNTVTPPTGFGVEPGASTIGSLADTTHTVDVEWISGTIVIHGVECTRSTGIVAARCAVGGRAYSQYTRGIINRFDIGITNGSSTITSTAPGVFNSSMIGKYLSSATTGLPADARITAVANAESATISANATATNTIVANLSVHPPSHESVPLQTVAPAFGEGLGQPDLLIIAAGVNDMGYLGGSSISTASTDLFREGLSTLLKGYYRQHFSPYDYTPDLIIVGEHLANFADALGQGPAFIAHAKSQAIGLDGAFIDIWGMGRRSYKYWDDLGYWNDVVHPNDAGNVAMAQPVLDLLTSA